MTPEKNYKKEKSMSTSLLEVFDNINFCVIRYTPRSLKVLFYILFQTMVQNNLNHLDLTEVTQYLILVYSSEKIPPTHTLFSYI